MNIHSVYKIFLSYFRWKRMRTFQKIFNVNNDTRILDVGGSLYNWKFLFQNPKLTILDITLPKDLMLRSNVSWILADGRNLPFKNNAFDIVYSNSVIEHLSTLGNQTGFAAECERVGRKLYIKTPDRWFPVEPHLITPFIHWLPRGLQRKPYKNFTVWGWITRPTDKVCERMFQEIRLLTKREMRSIFPGTDLWTERFFGLSKSIIAVKNEPANGK